jgi:hypothetical protein
VSDNQQVAKHRSAKIRPILSLLNNNSASKTATSIVESSTTSTEKTLSKTRSKTKSPKIVNTKEELKVIKQFYRTLVQEDFDIEKTRAILLEFNQTQLVKTLLQKIDEKEFINNNTDKITKRIVIKKSKEFVYFLEANELQYNNRKLHVKDDFIGVINTKMINATKKCSGTIVAKKIIKMFKKTGKLDINLPKNSEEASSQEVFEQLCIDVRELDKK